MSLQLLVMTGHHGGGITEREGSQRAVTLNARRHPHPGGNGVRLGKCSLAECQERV